MDTTDISLVKNNIIRAIRRWFDTGSGGALGAILGISGGKDSTVCAALLCEAIGKDKVLGLLLPNGMDLNNADYKDAVDICEYYGISYETVDISETYKSYLSNKNVTDHFVCDEFSRFNLPPRIRMMYLYMIGQPLNYRVIGTSNKSELAVGWFTKWGDNACDMNLLSTLSKTDVVRLGRALGVPAKWLDKAPSDGIRPTTDEENFGFTYEQLDAVIDKGVKDVENYDLIMKKIENAKHKFFMGTLENFM